MSYEHPLDKLLTARGMSRRKLAHKAGVSASYIDRLCRHRGEDRNTIYRPSDQQLAKLARALGDGVRIQDLIDHRHQSIVITVPEDGYLVYGLKPAVLEAAVLSTIADFKYNERASYGLAGATTT